MHKKDVPDVVQIMSYFMEKQRNVNKNIIVWSVNRHIHGKKEITASSVVNTGLSSGLLRVTRSEGYASFPDIVPLSLKVLRITGFHRNLKKESTIPKSDIWSTMPPIFIKMVVY
jgi:hypothetical protein